MHHALLLARNANGLAPNVSFQKDDGELERILPRNVGVRWTSHEEGAVKIVI